MENQGQRLEVIGKTKRSQEFGNRKHNLEACSLKLSLLSERKRAGGCFLVLLNRDGHLFHFSKMVPIKKICK
jgi:hypothetical protein